MTPHPDQPKPRGKDAIGASPCPGHVDPEPLPRQAAIAGDQPALYPEVAVLILLRIGRWELSIERRTPEPEGDPVPVDHPQPMQVWAPDYVGFLPPEADEVDE